MLATMRQIQYLQALTDRAEHIKMRHPSLIPDGLYHKRWDIGMTSEKAHLLILMYNAILAQCDQILFHRKKVAQNEDLPM